MSLSIDHSRDSKSPGKKSDILFEIEDQLCGEVSEYPQRRRGVYGILDSFKKFELEDIPNYEHMTDLEKAAVATSISPLKRSLKNRHIQMIAMGSSIGTGLFVGSGSVMRGGGPGSMMIAYSIMSSIIYCTIQAIGELSVIFPVAGSFLTYNSRFIDTSWGFAMAWNYAFGWLVVQPLELIATSVTIHFWNPDVNPGVFVVAFYVLIVFINLFGVRWFGEAEFAFSIVKVLAILGFIILGIVLICGGGPAGGFIGGRYWHQPGPFIDGFKGFCSVFLTVAFSFGGSEMVGLTAAESQNPREVFPKAIKKVFIRIILFYIVSLTIVSCLVLSSDDRLISTSSADTSASPFVIAIKNGGIRGLPSVMNVVVMLAALSVANSAFYASSRALSSLAASGYGPTQLAYIDRSGRPLVAMGVQAVVSLLSFLCFSSKEAEVFGWLMSLTGLSSFFTWGSICLCHIRYRRALSRQGRDLSEIAYTAQLGVYGSYYTIFMCAILLAGEFWIALFPIKAKPNAEIFFLNYLGLPIILMFYLGHKVWMRNWKLYIHSQDMDIDTGRLSVNTDLAEQEVADSKSILAEKPLYYRIYNTWC